MATEERKLEDARRLKKARKMGYGIGLLKGMKVTIKHLFKHNVVIQYPDEKQDLPARTRGVIALKEENCTVCMLCARECPDWCIYIDSHKETLPPKREGGRPRKRNVLDRFAIDYALCMYCGICVEVCPYDALFWSREFEYSEYDIRELTHEKERLSDWMATVLPPPELEAGAEVPGSPAATGSPATAAGAAGPGSAQRPSPPAAATAAAERPEQAQRQPAAAATAAPPQPAATQSQEQAGEVKAPQAEGRAQATEERAPAGEGKPEAAVATQGDTVQPEGLKSASEAASPEAFDRPEHDKAATTTEPERKTGAEAAAVEAGGSPHTTPGASSDASPSGQTEQEKGASATGDGLSDEQKAQYQESPGPNVEVPQEVAQPVALSPTEDPEAVYEQVLQEQLEKGSSPQVAEARAKVARVKAARGSSAAPTPIATDKMVPSAPTKGHPAPQEPSGAPEAADIQPDPGPGCADGRRSICRRRPGLGRGSRGGGVRPGADTRRFSDGAGERPRPRARASRRRRERRACGHSPGRGGRRSRCGLRACLGRRESQGVQRRRRPGPGEGRAGQGRARQEAVLMAETWQEVIFWILAIAMGVSAIRVVTTRNVVHAALYLVVTLMGAAAMYIMLFAEFVAWVQVLVYVGAIIVLMLFGLMLTRAPIGSGEFDNDQRGLAALVAGGMFGVSSWIMVGAFEGKRVNFARESGTSSAEVGAEIFSRFVLPFEVVSVLLLAALVGAVVIARRDRGGLETSQGTS